MKNMNRNNRTAAATANDAWQEEKEVLRRELAKATGPLSREEEREIFLVLGHTDCGNGRWYALRDRIFKAHIPLAVSLGSKIFRMRKLIDGKSAHSLLDCVHMAYVAIYAAIDKFDVERGNRFSTYAYKVICDTINKMYGRRKGRDKDDAVTESLYDPKVSGEIRTWSEQQDNPSNPVPDEIDARWEYERLWDGIRSLPQREQDILAARFELNGRNANLCDVAHKYGISTARASQIVKACEEKLRQHLAA